MQAPIFNHLHTMLVQLDELLNRAVEQVAENGYNADDALRGLVVRPQEADADLNQVPMVGAWDNEGNPGNIFGEDARLPFIQLMQTYQLSLADGWILLATLAPELDTRYQRLYGYLQNDVTLRYPTVNLMMHLLAAESPQRFEVYDRLQPHQPLRKFKLIDIEKPEQRPNTLFLQHHMKVDPAVIAFLMGQSELDPRLRTVLSKVSVPPNLHLPQADLLPILDALSQAPLVYMLGHTPLEHLETAYALCRERQMAVLNFDASRIEGHALYPQELWAMVLREAAMRQAALFISDWDAVLGESKQLDADIWQQILDFPHPIFLSAREKWEPDDMQRRRLLLRLEFESPDYDARFHAWRQLLGEVKIDEASLADLAVKYRFHRRQIVEAVQTAMDLAVSQGRALNMDDLQDAAQAHTRLKLGNYAQQVEKPIGWDKLILPDEQLTQLHEIVERVRHSHVVQDDWGYGNHISNSRGISALFAGESGTGKTLSAQVLATELGLPMYKIDLSGIVDKYIGETEKNLRVIFEEAKSNSAILFFDEADAIFGKRSEVKDARDRYANIEVAYLLQQIEDYDGIAILATNLRQNIDDAFTRRLDFLLSYPFPEAEYRYKIWKAHFPEKAPLSPNVDIMDLAQRYELAGGNIRNITLTAAYLAATEGDVIDTEHIRLAIRREHQKMGRLLSN